MKIHRPLEVKLKGETYVLLKTKTGQLRVYVGVNKDPAKPYRIFNVMTGQEEAVNIDILAANVSS